MFYPRGIAFPLRYSQDQNINIPETDNLSASVSRVFLVFLGPATLTNVCSSSLDEQLIHSHTTTTEVNKGTFFTWSFFIGCYEFLTASSLSVKCKATEMDSHICGLLALRVK
jgi:hypothetical protein